VSALTGSLTVDCADYKSNIPLLREEEKIKKSEEDLAGKLFVNGVNRNADPDSNCIMM
jgi:hypothetical protein